MTNPNFELNISKEELSNLPAESFSGEIVVVDSERQLGEVIPILEKAPIIGFDTETKPNFRKGQVNRIALLQLATPEAAFLIRLCKIGMPPQLKALLENENIFKVGLSIKDDFHGLSKLCNFKPAGFLDLQNYVREFNITDSSLTKIHAIIFGRRISKNQQLSNWEAPVLTPKQQEYAAIDARVCINIYRELKSGRFVPTDSPYCKPKGESQKG